MHPLDGAYLRVEWAEKRLSDLKGRIAEYVKQEGGIHPGELGPGPEVFLLLADDLPDQDAGTSLNVVAFPNYMIAVLNEAEDCLPSRHQLGDHCPGLLARPFPKAVWVYLQVLRLSLVENP